MAINPYPGYGDNFRFTVRTLSAGCHDKSRAWGFVSLASYSYLSLSDPPLVTFISLIINQAPEHVLWAILLKILSTQQTKWLLTE